MISHVSFIKMFCKKHKDLYASSRTCKNQKRGCTTTFCSPFI